MNDILTILYAHARALWRRRWLAITVAWAVCILGWLLVAVLPDRYEASARVYADARTALQRVVEGIAIDQDFDSELQMIREALLSRPQVEAVAHKTKLDVGVADPAGMDSLVSNLQQGIKIEATVSGDRSARRGGSDKRDTIYTITYQHPNREKSVEVVRTLLDNFVEGTLSGNRAGANEAQSFLSNQIAELEKRLAEAEERLAEFKKRNVGMLPGEGGSGDYFSRLATEQAGLQRARTDLAIAASRREELQRQLASARQYVPGTSSASSSSGLATDLSARIQQSEAELQDLLLRFTEKHPQVIALRESITDLKAREAKEIAELSSGGSGSGAIRSLSVNPVYQSIQTQLSQSEVEVAALRGAVSQHEMEIARLTSHVDSAPEVEQEYSRLNRDYDVIKAQYESLVRRLEQARVSDSAARSGVVRFEVIEPPHAALAPVFPNRRLLTVAVLFAGILAGVALALLPQFLRPTFDNTKSLANLTGLPVLGSVSLLPRAGAPLALRREIRWLSMAAVALVVVAGALLVIGDAGAHAIQKLLA